MAFVAPHTMKSGVDGRRMRAIDSLDDEQWHNIPAVVRDCVAQLFDERRALMATVEGLRQKQAESEALVRRVMEKQADMEVQLARSAAVAFAPSNLSQKNGTTVAGAAAEGGIVEVLSEQVGHLRRKVERQVTATHRVEIHLQAMESKTSHVFAEHTARLDANHETLTELTRQTSLLKQTVDDVQKREAAVADSVKNTCLLEVRQRCTTHEAAMTEHMSHVHTQNAELERDLRRTMAGIQATQLTLAAQIKEHDQVHTTRQEGALRVTEELKALCETRWEAAARQTAAVQAECLHALSTQSGELREAQLDTRRRVTRSEKRTHAQITRLEEELEQWKQRSADAAAGQEKRCAHMERTIVGQLREVAGHLTQVEHAAQARQEDSEARLSQLQRAHEALCVREGEGVELVSSLRMRIQHVEEQYDTVRALNERSDGALNQQYSRLVKALQELTEVHDKTEEQALRACSIGDELLRKLASLEQRCATVEQTCEDTQRHVSATWSSLPGKLDVCGEAVYTRAQAATEEVQRACERSIEVVRASAMTAAHEHDARIQSVEQALQTLRHDVVVTAAAMASENDGKRRSAHGARDTVHEKEEEKEEAFALFAAVDSLRQRVEAMEHLPADTAAHSVALEELRVQYAALSRQGVRVQQEEMETRMQTMRNEVQEMHTGFARTVHERYGALAVELHQMDNHANTTEYALTKLSTDVTGVLERLLYVEEVLATLRSGQEKSVAQTLVKDRVDVVERTVVQQEARIATLECARRALDESVNQLAWNKLLMASSACLANHGSAVASSDGDPHVGAAATKVAAAAAAMTGQDMNGAGMTPATAPTCADTAHSVAPPSAAHGDVWELRWAAMADRHAACAQRVDYLAESVACLRDKLERHEAACKADMAHRSHHHDEESELAVKNREEEVLRRTTELVEDAQSRLRDHVSVVQAMRHDVDELCQLHKSTRAWIDQRTREEAELKKQVLDLVASQRQQQQARREASEDGTSSTITKDDVTELVRREVHETCVRVFKELQPEWQDDVIRACSLHSGVSEEQMQAHTDTLQKLSDVVAKLTKKPSSSRSAGRNVDKPRDADEADGGGGQVVKEGTLLTLRTIAAQSVQECVRELCYTRPEMEERLENVWLSMIDLLARKEDVKRVDDKLASVRHAIHDELKEMLEHIID